MFLDLPCVLQLLFDSIIHTNSLFVDFWGLPTSPREYLLHYMMLTRSAERAFYLMGKAFTLSSLSIITAIGFICFYCVFWCCFQFCFPYYFSFYLI